MMRRANYLRFLSELLFYTVLVVGHSPKKLADTTYYSLSHVLLTLFGMFLFPRSKGPVFTLKALRFICHMDTSTWRDEFALNRNTHMCLFIRNSELSCTIKIFSPIQSAQISNIFFFLLLLKSE